MLNKRILIFSLAYHPVVGGAEIAVKEITDRISDIEFDVVTLRFNSNHLKVEKIGNVTVYRVDSSKTLFPVRAFLFGSKLHKKNKYNAIWAIMANWAGLVALFFKLRFPKVKYILTLQEGDSLEYIESKVKWIKPLFRKIFTKADFTQTISNFLKDFAIAQGYRKEIFVIPNGVDTNHFRKKDGGSNPNKITLITTSRLVKKNGVVDIIEAIKLLPENVELRILGVGPLESNLKEIVRKNNQENRVKFFGHIPYQEVLNHLHSADIFVRPSLSEGFGSSFIEAMAVGLPVVATQVGGIKDFLVDGETGLACNVNDPKSIADKVMEYVRNPDLVSKVTSNARKMVEERYDWKLIAERMKLEIFDKV